ncbi:Major Facilitator Superfamily protein [Corynebacterium ciconiae DSM 44920]|uniref:MFS transporter n=1 Tax=Corynebacterium ciconiae TaxID=227319 RepID=UPI0003A2FB7D|nr:MFS transporter [Corynebacterium ciconiae]WKD60321.1 Major Facilitator Superfamily protein [Corynebacterium ciconiae DSM 44920]
MNSHFSQQPQMNDRRMFMAIWPLLGAGALGLIPFTIFSNFLVDIAAVAETDAPRIGALRGLGGVSALLVGLAFAPLIDRMSRRAIASLSLLALAAACVAAAYGEVSTWIVFCLVVGAATSTLNPAIGAMAADSFEDEASSGRAATMVSACMTLTAMLAAPVLAGPALLWGWRGDVIATAVLCMVVAIFFWRTPRFDTNGTANQRPSYREGFVQAASIPAVLPLLAISLLRTAVFMGQLSYVAVYYDETFGVGPGIFSFVWTTSGLFFFMGNWCGGKLLASITNYRTAMYLLLAACGVAVASIILLFYAPHIAIAVAMTGMTAAAHAVIAACITTLLVRQAQGHRGTILALNGAGQSIGVFGGAAIAGAGLYVGDWHGMGLTLGCVTILAGIFGAYALRHIDSTRIG